MRLRELGCLLDSMAQSPLSFLACSEMPNTGCDNPSPALGTTLASDKHLSDTILGTGVAAGCGPLSGPGGGGLVIECR